MLKHIVMYKLKNRDDAEALVEKFLGMKGKIDVLLDLHAGVDVVLSGRSFDVCLECVFKDVEDLKKYILHPVHLPVKEFVGNIVEKSHSVDFLFD